MNHYFNILSIIFSYQIVLTEYFINSFFIPDCVDKMKCCSELASNGLCNNVAFVRQNCKYSCNAKCKEPVTQKPTTTTTTTTTEKTPATTTTPPTTTLRPTTTATTTDFSCVDKLDLCRTWSKPNQYCKNERGCCLVSLYKSYMTMSCSKSCGFC